jgi:hypothetical protein
MKKVHLKNTSMNDTTNSIVKLNIGGIRYLTTVQTLCAGRDNFFTVQKKFPYVMSLVDAESVVKKGLLSGKIPSLMDDDGYFFVDRNGEMFKYLLDFLRTNRLRVPPELLADVQTEASFYSLDMRESSLSDASLSRWLEEKQTTVTMQQWSKYPELEELKDKVLAAFRHEVQHGSGAFSFVFYPEMSSEGSVSRFIAKLIAEDEVSPEQRKVIETCKNQLLRCDFSRLRGFCLLFFVF